MIKLAIVGTRVLACHGDYERTISRIELALDRLQPDVIISGEAEGVDRIAERVAQRRGYSEGLGTLVVHRPAVRRFWGSGGYRERDVRIAEDCTHLLRISCKQATTYGSGFTADKAEMLGKVVVCCEVCAKFTTA